MIDFGLKYFSLNNGNENIKSSFRVYKNFILHPQFILIKLLLL